MGTLYQRNNLYAKRQQPQQDPNRFAQTILNQEQRIRAVGEEPPSPNVLISLLQGVGKTLDYPGKLVRTGLEKLDPTDFAGLTQGTNEWLTRQGMRDGWQKGLLSFAGDTVTNPLTYLTMGIEGAGTKGASAAATAAAKAASGATTDVIGEALAMSAAKQAPRLALRAGIPFLTRTAEIGIPGTEALAAPLVKAGEAGAKLAKPITDRLTRIFNRAGITEAATDVQRYATAGAQDLVQSAARESLGKGEGMWKNLGQKIVPMVEELKQHPADVTLGGVPTTTKVMLKGQGSAVPRAGLKLFADLDKARTDLQTALQALQANPADMALRQTVGKLAQKSKDTLYEILKQEGFHTAADADKLIQSTLGHVPFSVTKSDGSTLTQVFSDLNKARGIEALKTTYSGGAAKAATEAELATRYMDDPVRHASDLAKLPVDRRKAVMGLVKEFRGLNDSLFQLEKNAGFNYEQMRNYVYHLYDNPPAETEKLLNFWRTINKVGTPSAVGGTNRVAAQVAPRAGFSYHRLLPSFSEAEALGLKPVLDPERIAMVRTLVSANAQVKKGLIGELRNIAKDGEKLWGQGNFQYGPIVKVPMQKTVVQLANGKTKTRLMLGSLPEGWVPAHALVPRMFGYALHPDLARTLRNLDTVLTDNTVLRQFLGSLGQISGMWKSLVTTTPGHLTRNMIGNIFNTSLSDIPFAEQAILRGRTWGLLDGLSDIKLPGQLADNATIEIAGQPMQVGALKKLFTDEHLVGFGQYWDARGGGTLLQKGTGTLGKMGDVINKATAPAHNLGSLEETWAKMALFVGKLEGGMAPHQAANEVRKYLFDYTDITPVERWLKIFFPFYTWTKKEFPLLFEAVATNPSMYVMTNALSSNMTKNAGLNDQQVPDYLKDAMAIPVKVGDQVHFIDLGLPIGNMGQIKLPTSLSGTYDAVKETLAQGPGSMLAPEYKVPIELMTNTQLYSGAPIESRQHQTKDFMGAQVPAWMAYMLNQIPTPYARITSGDAMRGVSQTFGFEAQPRDGENELPQGPTPNALTGLLKLSGMGSMDQVINPERQQAIEEMLRSRELTDYISHLRKDKGINVPDIRELRKQGKRRGSSIYGLK